MASAIGGAFGVFVAVVLDALAAGQEVMPLVPGS
jgi:hypothetical protein